MINTHVLVLAESHYPELVKFINDLSAKWVPLGSARKQGHFNAAEQDADLVQVGVRDVKLLDITFPETSGAQVLGMLYPLDRDSRVPTFFSPLARLMGFSKFPRAWNYRPRDYREIVDHRFVHVVPLGWKRDVFVKGAEML